MLKIKRFVNLRACNGVWIVRFHSCSRISSPNWLPRFKKTLTEKRLIRYLVAEKLRILHTNNYSLIKNKQFVYLQFGLDKVGALIMIDDVTVWESKPRTQGKERTLFLFRHMILFTKKKMDGKSHHHGGGGGGGGGSGGGSSGGSPAASPVYCYKKHMQVQESSA